MNSPLDTGPGGSGSGSGSDSDHRRRRGERTSADSRASTPSSPRRAVRGSDRRTRIDDPRCADSSWLRSRRENASQAGGHLRAARPSCAPAGSESGPLGPVSRSAGSVRLPSTRWTRLPPGIANDGWQGSRSAHAQECCRAFDASDPHGNCCLSQCATARAVGTSAPEAAVLARGRVRAARVGPTASGLACHCRQAGGGRGANRCLPSTRTRTRELCGNQGGDGAGRPPRPVAGTPHARAV
jgi:hypothetical protein